MTDAPSTSADPGRWIRAALVLFPAGTILLGIASFGIWQWKKDQAEDRSFKYAMALRRTISMEGIQRHADIVREALSKPDRDLSIPGYLESTMGEENMGYTVRRQRLGGDKSNIDAELSGKQRPREIVLALVLYNDDTARMEGSALAIAETLSVAHELTGEAVLRTLRFAIVPDTAAALLEIKEGMRRDDERLLHLLVLGGPDAGVITRLQAVLETTKAGTRVIERAATTTPQAAFQSAHELKALLLHAAERP